MNLSILYRGPLSSCNYACGYCPFAKTTDTADQLAHDRACLERFVGWVGGRTADAVGVLFTPWGEALVRRWYPEALAALTHMPHVVKAAAQTNLSCKLDWVEACDRSKLALWCTYHPGETTRERFLAKCRELLARGVRFSVGVVGMKEHLAEIDALRRELPPDVYLWVNAYKREPDYYTAEMVEGLTRIDPLFPVNNQRHPSLGEPCRAGSSVISVDGDGTVRRCHFVREPIGNIYAADFEGCLAERPCPNESCGCHIGYVHLDRLRLYDTFGDGVLERIRVERVCRLADGTGRSARRVVANDPLTDAELQSREYLREGDFEEPLAGGSCLRPEGAQQHSPGSPSSAHPGDAAPDHPP